MYALMRKNEVHTMVVSMYPLTLEEAEQQVETCTAREARAIAEYSIPSGLVWEYFKARLVVE